MYGMAITRGDEMNVQLKTAKDLKAGVRFAMKNSDISFNMAKVLSVTSKDELEIEISYEFEIFGKTYQRRDVLAKNSFVFVME